MHHLQTKGLDRCMAMNTAGGPWHSYISCQQAHNQFMFPSIFHKSLSLTSFSSYNTGIIALNDFPAYRL